MLRKSKCDGETFNPHQLLQPPTPDFPSEVIEAEGSGVGTRLAAKSPSFVETLAYRVTRFF
jgi:hypothetical protein